MSGLLLLCSVLSLWGGVCGRPGQYCADQPSGVEAFAGDSVTFPCSFVFPRNLIGITNRTIIFQAGETNYCGDRIYNSRYDNTTQEYQGRVSLVGDPQAQNGTITLTSVTTNDIKNYCCRVQLLNQSTIIQQWQNGAGTHLTVRGKNDMTMDQPLFILALVGDTVTIPCNFSIRSKKNIQKISVSSVQWSFGEFPSCERVIYNSNTGAVRSEDTERISVEEGDTSILIKQVKTNDSGWYCCGARVTGDGQVYTTHRERGTNLIIKGETKRMNIKQPKEVTFPDSSTISCNFTLPEDEDPLWVGIYWMFGNPRGGFAYHPDPQLIHPRYRGKTRLVGQSDLYLEEVIGMDNNTTFYCRVAMRLCKDTLLNTIETLLEEGAGTLLHIMNVASDPDDQTKIIAAATGSVIIFILLILIILCLIKCKGKRKQLNQSEQKDPATGMNAGGGTPEYEDAKSVRREQETDMGYYTTVGEMTRASTDPSNSGDQLVYSTLDHTRPSIKPKPPPDSAQEILYADVQRK